MKKGAVILFVVLAIAVLSGVFYFLNDTKRYKDNDAIKGVPVNAAVILKISEISSFSNLLLNDIEFKNELKKFSLSSKIYDLLDDIDSSEVFRSSYFTRIKNKPLIVSFHIQGKNNIAVLLTSDYKNKAEENDLLDWIKGLSAKGYQISTKLVDAVDIYSVKKEGAKRACYVSFYDGIILCSYSDLLVESAVRQLESGNSLLSNSVFNNVYRTSGENSPMNIYVNFVAVPKLLSVTFLKSKNIPDVFRINNALWAELDVEIKSKEIGMNGFIAGNRNNFLNELFVDMKPQKPVIYKVFPANTRVYMAYNPESSAELNKRFHSYLEKSDNENEYNKSIKKVRSDYRIDIEKELFSFFEDEMALVFTDLKSSDPDINSFLVAGTKGKSFSLDKMRKMLNASGISTDPVNVYKVDDDTSFPIYKGLPAGVLKTVMGWFFPVVPDKYFAFYENYIVFSNSISSLHDFLYSNVLKQTLANKKHFADFREKFPVRENYFVYSEIPVLPGYLKDVLKPELVNFNEEQKEALAKFYAAGFQVTSTGGMLYSNIYANYLPARENEPQTIWQSLLDSTVINKPVLVKNHYTGEKELMVQDAKFNLYLINNSGRLLWKKPLDGKIMGTIEQIDYYRNSKLQYIFNTKNKIYLLDRNGNYVDKYPVTLPVKATNGIAVMDYDKNRDYRLFLATEDRKVKLFDKRGNIITGWEFKKTEGPVRQPVQHFRSNSKDYIVFSDDHKIYILNRRGNVRVKTSKHVAAASNSKFFIRGQNTPDCMLVTASPNAEVILISIPTGKVAVKTFIDKTEEFVFSYFEENGKSRFVFLKPDNLKIFDFKGKELVSKSFGNQMSLTIDQYRFSANNIKLGIIEKDGEHIYLFNSDGSLYRGFPLRGRSRFSIGFLKSSSSRFNLVVGGDNNYIYNYRVE